MYLWGWLGLLVIEKEKVRQLKTQNEARRAQLVSQTEGLSERRAAGIDVLKKDIARTTSKWSAISSRTAEARVFLCREVALLYGLKSRKRKSKGTVEYLIGGVVIPSLSELNSASHMQISTVMGHLSHLLILASHYLSIKLPHEITLAGRVSPYTTIKSPRNSRPRPLNIQTDLRTLLRENLAEYTLFLEGYSMLCHNIAFLGYTQGITLTSLEEICLPGPSLYRILFVKDPTPGHPLKFGRCSHGTAYGFLGKADGQEVMKNWKIQLTEVYEAVRKVVHGDEINAEWDLVDVNEKDDDGWMKVRSVQR